MIPKLRPGDILKIGFGMNLNRVFIDTTILIYAMQMHPKFGSRSKEVLESVDRGDASGVTSNLVQLEVCWYLESRNRVDEMKIAIQILRESRLDLVDVSGVDVSSAVLLKQSRREIDLNDLVNYCLMKRLGVEDIYTNDQHFKQLPDINPQF